ncbi:MAG: hypothetical protein GF332_01415 [Candidatus Moranbacteria bacterium]|nr:hypothetical protein [Candidatus Moranbacteria bacterium]
MRVLDAKHILTQTLIGYSEVSENNDREVIILDTVKNEQKQQDSTSRQFIPPLGGFGTVDTLNGDIEMENVDRYKPELLDTIEKSKLKQEKIEMIKEKIEMINDYLKNLNNHSDYFKKEFGFAFNLDSFDVDNVPFNKFKSVKLDKLYKQIYNLSNYLDNNSDNNLDIFLNRFKEFLTNNDLYQYYIDIKLFNNGVSG